MTWRWLRKGNLKRKTKSLLTEAQNNAVRTNYVKTKIDYTQQNIKGRFCGEINKTINHIVSESIRLGQEYMTRHDWVGNMIHWELCKILKFDHTTKYICTNQNLVLRMRQILAFQQTID